MTITFKRKLSFCAAGVLAAATLAAQPRRDVYLQHNLTSDLPARAERRDPNLVNPWGISASPTSPFFVSDNHTGVATMYNGKGIPQPAGNPLIVTIPVPSGGTPPAAPTGNVFNSTTDFELAPGKPAVFILATEDGTISGWNPMVNATNAILKVDNSRSGAVYKGLALGSNGGANFLFATNFFAATVDVFDAHFAPVSIPGGFVDASIPAGFAPFGIANIGGLLFVSYAKQNAEKHDDVAGPGNGFINVFTTGGVLVRRFFSQGPLNSPWGMVMAPSGFGAFSGTLLVGNFGDGHISAFDLSSRNFLGQLLEPSGRPITILGLWGLIFGNGFNDTSTNVLYFTAGIPDGGAVEDHGLFGEIRAQHP